MTIANEMKEIETNCSEFFSTLVGRTISNEEKDCLRFGVVETNDDVVTNMLDALQPYVKNHDVTPEVYNNPFLLSIYMNELSTNSIN